MTTDACARRLVQRAAKLMDVGLTTGILLSAAMTVTLPGHRRAAVA